VVDRFVARLEAAHAGRDAPAIGESLPPFILPDHQGRLVSLPELLADAPVVVVFLRGHWCPYCRLTIAALAEVQHRIGASRIVAISAETQRFVRRIRAEAGAEFRFLTDMDAQYCSAIGLAITVDPALSALYQRRIGRVPDFQQTEGWVLPMPAVFVLDRSGIVRARHIDPDYRRRMEIDALLEAVAALGG
jgi:peroxiredoxin